MIADHLIERSPITGSVHPPILIIGLGNPILGDDGVGWRVAELVAAQLGLIKIEKRIPSNLNTPLRNPTIEIDFLSVGGLSLMERLIGYQKVIIIDAMSTGNSPIGTVTTFHLYELPDQAFGHISSVHDTSLQNALKIGQAMGAHLPQEIQIVGIEANEVYNFSEELSPIVTAALDQAVNTVMELIK
jgi:hydrogenase maturation protease